MAEEKVRCRKCDVEFLKSTADCTDGLCMPCHLGKDRKPGDRDGLISAGSGEKLTAKEWAVGCLGLTAAGAIFFLLGPAAGLVVALIARYFFEVSWSTAFFVGFGAYLLLGFLGSLSDAFSSIGDTVKESKKKAFNKRWQERHGQRSVASDDQ